MIKHYKILLLSFAIFIAFGIAPAEQPVITKLRTKVPSKVVEVPPADLSEVEENERELWEMITELKWKNEKLKKDRLKL